MALALAAMERELEAMEKDAARLHREAKEHNIHGRLKGRLGSNLASSTVMSQKLTHYMNCTYKPVLYYPVLQSLTACTDSYRLS